ncbi:MAG: DUF3800 domain-containing protein [Thermoplasmata archaeon]|nr:MAG: DUF3800 domain-containing protein [Thermoplasmata archaeon]KAA0015655.1 MAG: DUF3800 domain-containing protein [Thermoplasmata archaeon]
MKLIFSDEAGEIKPSKYYIRSAVMIPEEKYFVMQRDFFKLKKEYEIPLNEELKTSDIWHLKLYQEGKRPLPKKHRKRLHKYTKRHYTHYLKFIERSLNLLPGDAVIITTWTHFFDNVFKEQDEIERDFLQTIMLRVEDELKEYGERGIMLYDQTSMDKIAGYYHDIFIEGEFVNEYSHIKDSIAFEVSTFSSGIQIVDYIANITYNSLRRYSMSLDIFKKTIKPKLRRKQGIDVIKTGFIPLYLGGYHKGGTDLIDIITDALELNASDSVPSDYHNVLI